ncbi:hypothetical protein EDD18DRAFT_1337281 [Armillaria luteobubalina]|uniref:Uncharacterized protein n=1 Tax=Armillaria luteobubalina TaxID=153913 RepID=A0AA39UB41_9AGAR|nr:hypothetical protein EDD18DRAFT_1337281 [Armillaria luteobubalina]
MMFFTRILAFLSVSALLSAALPLVPRANVGEGTWYYPGLGSCGITNTASDMIVGGFAPVVRIVSSCCCVGPRFAARNWLRPTEESRLPLPLQINAWDAPGKHDLDFPPTTFSRVARTDVGRLTGVSWKWA